VVVVVAGGALLLRDDDSDENRGLTNTPSPSLSEDPLDGVVPWEMVDPRHPDASRLLGPVEARQVDFVGGAAGQPSTFVVELVALERDVSLGVCPDAELHARHSFDDESIVAYGLNCPDVPFKDTGGTPYLPKGVAVRFAVETTLPDVVPAYSWRLNAPGAISAELTVPVLTPEDARMPPGQGEGNLYVDIPNEAFLGPPFRLQIWIDEAKVVDVKFEMAGQDGVTTYGYRVPRGEHEIRIVSPSDELSRTLSFRENTTHFLQVSGDAGSPDYLEWRLQSRAFLYN
jgi:hypothetical protein